MRFVYVYGVCLQFAVKKIEEEEGEEVKKPPVRAKRHRPRLDLKTLEACSRLRPRERTRLTFPTKYFKS